MPHNLRLSLINDLNLLRELSAKGLENFPNEICLFFTDELNLKSTAIYEESTANNFKLLGKSNSFPQNITTENLSIDNYNTIIENEKFEQTYSANCELESISEENLQSIIFRLNEAKHGLIIINHKVAPSFTNKSKFLPLANLTADLINNRREVKNSFINKSANKPNKLLSKSIKGFIKEIKTINGLVSLSQDEQNLKNILANLDEIKSSNKFLVEGFNDLLQILNAENKIKPVKQVIFLKDVLDRVIISLDSSVVFNLTNVVESKIETDEKLLSKILHTYLQFAANCSTKNKIEINTSIGDKNNLHIGIVSIKSKLKPDAIQSLFTPFKNRELLNNISGLSLPLANKYIEYLDGSINPFIEEKDLHINISIPLGPKESEEKIEIVKNAADSNRDKILVIESDNASTTLLNNYLSKWNYETEFVSSGDVALKRLQQEKFVSVILNVDQENDNSLELLQKIKNNKATRNTPVIVFTLEAEKEKIYLMGSVEYLVKPINYNNLVEILTSYKLRRNSTVLCVDDDQPTLNLVKQAVQTAGFNVVAEYRPELVVDLIQDKDLDLAIIDLDMPKLNGFDLIKQIKSHDKFAKLPIIIYTGKEDYQEDLQKIDGMFVDLLDKKSTSFNELENTISAMINSYEEPHQIDDIKESPDSPKILMAEDYKHSQIIVTRLLKKSGFENVIVVENGEEALNICKDEKIDLILMDMQMPVMNGFEATGKIRELEGYADTPIISLTAFAMKGDREKCLESGATDYIPKPIDSKEFIEKVKYYTQVKIES